MRMTLEIDSRKGVAWLRVSGALDIPTVFERAGEFVDHPDFVKGMPTIWDVREADLSSYASSAMRSAGEQNRELAPRRGSARLAIVVSSELGLGLARMHEVLAESPNLEIAIFRDVAAAEAWALGSGRSGGETSAT